MKIKTLLLTICILLLHFGADAAQKNNAYGQKFFTVESAHFKIHYHAGLDHLTKRVANKLEELYNIYTDTYDLTLPGKTEVVIYDGDIPEGFAYPNFNFIFIGVHDYEFNLRGSSDWFDDVVTHEFAHVVSISTGFKLSPKIPSIQVGYFTHPNQSFRTEALHVYPSEVLPPWFTEGIAQYESSRHGADSWDTHRDMILRSLTASGKLLSWAHMNVFTGRGDDYEKTYNHGFSLVKYISETYGYDKILALLRESSRFDRLTFDASIKAALGISAQELYYNWKKSLEATYRAQIKDIGTQVYGRKINKDGFDNDLPRFSPDGKKIYFLSNGKNEYSFRSLVSYNLSDTVEDKKKIKVEMGVSNDYDIHAPSGRIAFVSRHSNKSVQDSKLGGQRTFDLFIDTLPPEKPKFSLFKKKTERQVTTQRSILTTAFSPDGNRLACAERKYDKYYLAITDTSGKDFRVVYPRIKSKSDFYKKVSLPETGSDSATFNVIFSLNWSPDGHSIAIDYIDGDNRKIGIYDTLNKTFSVICDTDKDERHPYFSKDGSALYFSSDRTGIFNIYRYVFSDNKLERLTNVAGGAFSPSVSPDGKKLVFTGYDPDGYGIYLLDSIKVLNSETLSNAVVLRGKDVKEESRISLSNRRHYSRFPKQFLMVPTLIGEQIVTSDDDFTKGVTRMKAGLVCNLMDPLAWAGVGTEAGAFLLIEPSRILSFFSLDKGGINPLASYDAGVFASTSVLPINLSIDYMIRGIAGEDWFYEESEEAMLKLPYNIQLHNFLLSAMYPLGKTAGLTAFTGYNRYDVGLDLEEAYDQSFFRYNLSKGFRAGAMFNFMNAAINPRMNVSPTGMAAKVQYNFWNQYSLKEENSFDTNSTVLKESYDRYLFHEVTGRFKFGMNSPLYSKHDIHLDLSGAYIKPINDPAIPSFYEPVAQVPGYIYYYKYEREDTNGDTIITDTVLVSGKAVLSGELSYRFPLWPKSIDRKWSFLYFDRIYGAINVCGGAGWENPEDALKFKRSDWLLSYGAELRLEAISFNAYPFALKFRWDYGMDRADTLGMPEGIKPDVATLGGNRFALSIGFDFDGWGLMSTPDYFLPSRMKSGFSGRIHN